MSPARSASASAGRSNGGGRAAMTALVVVAVAVGMLLLVRSRPDIEPFDPRSSGSQGTNGAVLLLREFGASVDITSRAPMPNAEERVFVIADRLNDDQRRDLLEFVDAGGIAVVADPASSLHEGGSVGADTVSGGVLPDIFGGGNQLPADAEANVSTGDCTIGSLSTLRGIFTPDGLLFPVDGEQDHCFGAASNSFVIVRQYGKGAVVGFGDNNVVTNAYLRYADNSGLVTALLAPNEGARVRIMLGTEGKPSVADIGQGEETLVDLVRPGVWMALSQLALAFVVFSFARGVRPGRAVREPLPIPIAGNELVLATGNLMQRAHHHQRAGWLVRGEFYRQLVAYYRTPPDISIDRLSALVAARSGVDPAELRSVLDAEIGGDGLGASDALLQLAARIDWLRRRTISDSANPFVAAPISNNPTHQPMISDPHQMTKPE